MQSPIKGILDIKAKRRKKGEEREGTGKEKKSG
jgi:hypothetical protein